ncbi:MULTISPECIES: hypothetical protein [unclassified Streptomyces]|jgi:hypothetical protein|uniref:hypothetical protein n=1 Tax=unclassified Streptomyces TaxID=2593676 RepID=UPI00308E6626|nr:hypothetical protein OG518_19405 [Streptomyces sp. NBC_01397]
MAEDTGDGGGGSPWAGFGILGAVGAAQAAVGEIVTELESFTKFQQRVDQLIKDLSGSDAGPKKIGQEPLSRHQFGGGAGDWGDAAGLFTSYQTVLTELENLSKVLSDSIEGMGIAVLASHKGYANIDVDIRDRMAAISAETKDHYGGDYDPEKSKLWHQGQGPKMDEIATEDATHAKGKPDEPAASPSPKSESTASAGNKHGAA